MNGRDIQRLLAAAGYYAGGIDGDFGSGSRAAVDKVLARNMSDALDWSEDRQNVAAAQIILDKAGHEPGAIDGYAGRNTLEALNAWDFERTNGKKEILPGRLDTPAPSKPGAKWPSQANCTTFYGPPGNGRCTEGVVVLPTPFRVAWNLNQKVQRFNCHVLVADAFTSIHRETFQHYGEAQHKALRLDVWGGCYNLRKMRGGTSWSMHAYGIAEDIDPEHNQLRWGRDRATLARAEYEPFWRIVESTGAVSLGRVRNYDWMHYQFSTL